MDKKKHFQKTEMNKNGHIVQTIVKYQLYSILSAIPHLAVMWLSSIESIFLDEETLMSVISSFAEIIAGLYGITMAGYTFFLSRIDALVAADTTLDYIVSCVKQRYKKLIIYISFNVGFTLIFCLVIMTNPISNGREYYLYRLFCNEFFAFLCSSIGLILYYSGSVIDPNSISNEADIQKKLLSSDVNEVDDVTEFVALYKKIALKCNELIPTDVLSQIHADKGQRLEYTIKFLEMHRPDLKALVDDIVKVHRYYQCMVNCKTMSVTQEICVTANSLLSLLEKTQ